MIKAKSKKWVDPQDVEITDPRLKAFECGGVDGETEEDQGKALLSLIEELWLEKKGFTSATYSEKQAAIKDLHEMMRDFDSDDPDLCGGVRKAINKLGNKKYADSVHAAESSIDHRNKVWGDRFSKRQTTIAKQTRSQGSKNELVEELENLVSTYPEITASEVERRLEQHADEATEDKFYGRDGELVLRSGIKDRIYRMKKKHSKQ